MNKKKRGLFVPDWAHDAIWYQIFPERFRNACVWSAPQIADISNHPVPGWTVCPWGMDWYSRQDWEKPLGDFFKSVYLRRFGGDLVGVIEKLDYLRELGVNALYLNPVFTAPSLHKYDAACLHHVDPTLGPDRTGDLDLLARAGETEAPGTWIWTAADRCLLQLIAEAHQRGMKVILDGVFNHTGTQFFAFQDIVKNGRRSRFLDWYRIKEWKPDGTFDYVGWFGHKGLPELGRTRTNLAPPVREYIFNITRRWMDPNGDGDPSDGVDGWRLDVAFCVPHGFWKSWRRVVRRINPEAYTTGEIVGLAREYLQGDEFDAVMNYMWLYPTLGFFSPCANPLPAAELRRRLTALRRAYPAQVAPVLQNLLGSHDTGRILTLLENAAPPFPDWDSYFNFPRAHGPAQIKTGRPGPRARAALRQMVIFQMTYVGSPMIYYGDEVGMWGANDPDNRQPMLWDDIRYEPEQCGPHGPVRRAARRPDAELMAFYRRAIGLRHAHAVLRRGGLRWLNVGDERLLAFVRSDRWEHLTIILNASDEARPFRASQASVELWSGRKTAAGRLMIPPRGWAILQAG